MNDENGTLTNVILRTVFAGYLAHKAMNDIIMNDNRPRQVTLVARWHNSA